MADRRVPSAHDVEAVGGEVDEDRALEAVVTHSSATARTASGVGGDNSVTSHAAPTSATSRRAAPAAAAARVASTSCTVTSWRSATRVMTTWLPMLPSPITPTCMACEYGQRRAVGQPCPATGAATSRRDRGGLAWPCATA